MAGSSLYVTTTQKPKLVPFHPLLHNNTTTIIMKITLLSSTAIGLLQAANVFAHEIDVSTRGITRGMFELWAHFLDGLSCSLYRRRLLSSHHSSYPIPTYFFKSDTQSPRLHHSPKSPRLHRLQPRRRSSWLDRHAGMFQSLLF